VVARAQALREQQQKQTVLFVDEVHRFNKAQQDAFLPYVEDGILIFIGATTENPSFELNNALLSRLRVYVLKRLRDEDILEIIDIALQDKERGLGNRNIHFPPKLKQRLAQYADGDARQALNLLEIIADFAIEEDGHEHITEESLNEILSGSIRRFDKGGDLFYEQISALHKSVRGTSPDAALYWFARMIDGGCDPEYIARRIVRMASEDIGNADPRALTLALNAWETYQRLGSPEGELALAQAVTYMACAPKSNAVYKALGAAMRDAKKEGSLDVPLHLRNAPTRLMKSLNYGADYRYAHNEPDAYAAGETYFPAEIGERIYYEPVPRGLEIKIAEKLTALRKLTDKPKK
jgi:putative ATPase